MANLLYLEAWEDSRGNQKIVMLDDPCSLLAEIHEDQQIILFEMVFSQFSQPLLGSGVSKRPERAIYTNRQRQASNNRWKCLASLGNGSWATDILQATYKDGCCPESLSASSLQC